MGKLRKILLSGPYVRLTLRLKQADNSEETRHYRYADMNEPTIEAAEATLRKALTKEYGHPVPRFARRIASVHKKRRAKK